MPGNDLTVLVKITAVFKEALSGLKKVTTELKNLSQTAKKTQGGVEGASQRSQLDLRAWSEAFVTLGALGTGAMYALINASPSLGVQFTQVSFAVNKLAMTIGEELAPYLQGITDLIVKLIDWVSSLPAPIRQWIGLTIALSAAIGVLTAAVLALNIVLSPELLIILAIIAAIAAIIVVIKNWGKIVQWFKDLFSKAFAFIKDKWNDFYNAFEPKIKSIKEYLKDLGEDTIEWFKGKWDDFVSSITSGWGKIREGFKESVEFIKNLWTSLMDTLTGTFSIGENIGEALSAFKEALVDAVTGAVKGFVNSLIDEINKVIDVINGILEAIDSVTPGELGRVGKIPKFHSGGLVPGSGEMLAILQGGEFVLSRQQVAMLSRGVGNTVNISLRIDQPVLRDSQDIDELANRVSQKIREELERGASW